MTKCTDNLTLGEIKELMNLFNNKQSNDLQPFEIGKAYLIRTVTQINIGIVKAVGDKELILSDASCIAETGRFYDTLKNGVSQLNEVEPFIDDVIIGRGAIVDATIWNHKELPRSQK